MPGNAIYVLRELRTLVLAGLVLQDDSDFYTKGNNKPIAADKWRDDAVIRLHNISEDLGQIGRLLAGDIDSELISVLIERALKYQKHLHQLSDELYDTPYPLGQYDMATIKSILVERKKVREAAGAE